jgi:hypothetical protein
MGGLDGLRRIDRVPIVAWAGIFPLTDLASIIPTSRPGIEATLGSRFPFYWRTLSPEHVVFPKGLPMIFWSSYGDKVVPRIYNTDVTARDARCDGARVTVVTTIGNHGDPSNFQPARLVQFFEHAGQHYVARVG